MQWIDDMNSLTAQFSAALVHYGVGTHIVNGMYKTNPDHNNMVNWSRGFIYYNDFIYPFIQSWQHLNNPDIKLRLVYIEESRQYDNVQGSTLPISRYTFFQFVPSSFPNIIHTIDDPDSLFRLKSIQELSQFSMPDGVVVDPNYLAFTQVMLDKLNGIQAGAQVNVKPSWTAAAGSANEILNKPDILDVLTRGTVNIGDIGNASYPVNFIGYTAPTTNYAVYVSFETVSGSTALNSATYYYVVHSKTTTGFQITMRETGNVQQALILNYMIVRNLN